MANAIEHVVVVMLENRSYDNVLGWTRGGLTGNESNPNPYGGTQTVLNQPTQQIGGHGQTWPGTTIPMIDPGEKFSAMSQQFLNQVPTDAPPYANYSPDAEGLMQGFMNNYGQVSGMTPHNIQDVMNYLTAAQLPVTAFLANQFAVCDRWFASVPTQTFTNRLFAFCAAPGVLRVLERVYSVVDDDQYAFDPLSLRPLPEVVQLPSICSQLDAVLGTATPSWKIYLHDYSIAVLTIPYIADAAKSAANVNVATFDDSDWGDNRPKQLGAVPSTFAEDVANGTLPPFSFIEPRYSRSFAANKLPPNSNHPGPGNYGILTHSDPSDPPIDASGGELLLMQVYNLLRGSKYWDSTLLIITYDEHGGVYDHVPPPPATPPGPNIPLAASWTDPTAHGFGYTVFGGRVPAIIVSPHVAAGATITNDPPFDHSSIVKTVWDAFNLSQPGVTSLTQRDANAPSVMSFLDANTNNDAPLFSGTIVASPSALVFIGGVTSEALLFSAGAGVAVAATPADDWLQLSDPQLQTGVIAVTVSVVAGNLASGTYTSSITISGTGVQDVVVPVTLYVS